MITDTAANLESRIQEFSKAAFGNRHFVKIVKAIDEAAGVHSVRSIARTANLADSVVKPVLERLQTLGALTPMSDSDRRLFAINRVRFAVHLRYAFEVEQHALEGVMTLKDEVLQLVASRFDARTQTLMAAAIEPLDPSKQYDQLLVLVSKVAGVAPADVMDYLHSTQDDAE